MPILLFIFTALAISCTHVVKVTDHVQIPLFDHAFTLTEREADYDEVLARGFTSTGQKVKHPGPVTCQFIAFKPTHYPFPQYLEWCVSQNIAEMNRRVLKTSGTFFKPAGLGFRMSGDVRPYFAKIKDLFEPFEIKYDHKNYDWEKNSKDHLPGWDYISFKKPLVQGIEVFAISYGPRNKIYDPSTYQHPNGADSISEIFVQIPKVELERIKTFISGSRNGSSIANHPAFQITNLEPQSPLGLLLKEKTGSVKAVVVKVQDVKRFIQVAKPDYKVKVGEQTYHGLRRPNYAWDILATQ